MGHFFRGPRVLLGSQAWILSASLATHGSQLTDGASVIVSVSFAK